MVGTVDLLYIRGVDQFDITDVNLQPPTATAAGEGGRLLYGTFDEFGNRLAQPAESRLRDRGADPELQRRPVPQRQLAGREAIRRGDHVSLAYTYTDARDRMSPDCFNVTCNLYLTPLDGTIDNRRLTTSNFSVAHKVTLGVIADAPLHTRAGLFYNGYSGRPYTYMVHGDANADGLSFVELGNDIMYVPKDPRTSPWPIPSQWLGLDRLIL